MNSLSRDSYIGMILSLDASDAIRMQQRIYDGSPFKHDLLE